MVLRGARILAIAGVAFFALRGVVGALPPAALAAAVLALLLAAAVLERLWVSRARCPIGELACRQGLLTPERVARVLALQRRGGGRFGEIAVRERFLTATQLGTLLKLQLGGPGAATP